MALDALDQVIDAASTRGLRLTLILARNWGPSDSKVTRPRGSRVAAAASACQGLCALRSNRSLPSNFYQSTLSDAPSPSPSSPAPTQANYAGWSGLQTPDNFFTSPQAKQAYKDHLSFMVNRKNSVNGRVYKDDPTIMVRALAEWG